MKGFAAKGFTAAIENGTLVVRVPIRVDMVNMEKLDEARVALAELTRREGEVFKLLRRRLANKEIANALHVSERTVKFYVSQLFMKLRCSSRAELIFKFGYEE